MDCNCSLLQLLHVHFEGGVRLHFIARALTCSCIYAITMVEITSNCIGTLSVLLSNSLAQLIVSALRTAHSESLVEVAEVSTHAIYKAL